MERDASPRLSLCMIVKDEADCLDRALASAAEVADELVIADTGSSDGTPDIIRRWAGRVLAFPWVDDFAAARNFTLEQATGDWVLVLDADEWLRPGAGAALRQALLRADVLGYRLPIVSHQPDGSAATEHISRLFRRLPGLRFQGLIHEQITPSLSALMATEPGWSVESRPDVVIEHDGYLPLACEKHRKRERNVGLLRRLVAQSPDEPYGRYKLSQALGPGSEATEQLFEAARRLLALPPAALRRQGIACEIVVNAAFAWLGAGRVAEAAAACSAAAEHLPPHPALDFAFGNALVAGGRLPEARAVLERALATPAPPGGAHFDAVELDRELHVLYARVLCQLGEAARARAVLEAARPRHPDAGRLIHLLQEALLLGGDPVAAMREGLAWLRRHPGDGRCLLLCAQAAERCGRPDVAAEWRARAAGQGPPVSAPGT